jgi:hypothetical protein
MPDGFKLQRIDVIPTRLEPYELKPGSTSNVDGTTIFLLHIQFFTMKGTEFFVLQEYRCGMFLQ